MGALYVMHYLGQSNIGAGLGAGALYIGKGIVVGRASRTCTWPRPPGSRCWTAAQA